MYLFSPLYWESVRTIRGYKKDNFFGIEKYLIDKGCALVKDKEVMSKKCTMITSKADYS